jgi:hypothetical protein
LHLFNKGRQMQFRIGLIVLALGILMAALGAQQAPNKTPASKPAPVVTVTKTDGTLVRGQIVSSDPDQVVVKPALKAGEKIAGDDVAIAWKEIKIVSNGLTQKKALEAWKEEHAKELCDKCGGERVVTCPTCKGTGHDPKSSKECKTCNGAMEVKCKAPKCKEGKIPCPKPCLKLSEGHWIKKEDGKRWRVFSIRGGASFQYSEGHLGQLITLDKDGTPHAGAMCTTCEGKGEINCPECHGTAKVPCKTCKANADAPKCADCEGAGFKKCVACDGSGLKKAPGAAQEEVKANQ